jgi:hypothetical protein
MTNVGPAEIERLKAEWTGQYVLAADRPELQRFAGRVGRVVTVNWNGKAIVDFADGAWYDLPASADHLRRVDPSEAQGKYDPKVNSAQPHPDRQS